MKVAAIIAEYNTFHNGHKYHIEETKKLTGADYVVAIISGNYVQRGTPAIINKYCRTEMALNNGIDLVIELPTCYATSSAEYFAYGAVSILNQLGVVDYLCFGSECADIETLTYIANILVTNPVEYSFALNSYLRKGNSFPKARQLALTEYAKNLKNSELDIDKLINVIEAPNNILGIEYIKSLIKLNSNIKPITILRKGEGYNSDLLPDDNNLSSASGIRNHIIHSGLGDDKVLNYMPNDCYDILKDNYKKTFPIHMDDFTQLAYFALQKENNVSLTQYVDIDQNIANKLINSKENLDELGYYIGSLKTKDITYTRLSRSILHIMLGLKDTNMNDYMNNPCEYARILGFKESSSTLLKTIKKNSSLNIVSKLSLGMKKLTLTGRTMLEMDINASNIYNKIVYWKYQQTIPNEYKHGVVIK